MCHARLKEVREVEHHKETLAEDKIVYHEQGHAARELGPSISILDPFTSWDDFGADPYISATCMSLSWGGADLPTSALSPSTSWSDF